jgi:DNA-binding transcriptional LysR family regulator
VRGSIVTNHGELALAMVEKGLGLAYVIEAVVKEPLRAGRLVEVLEPYAPKVPGFFLYYPSRAQRSPPLRLFIEATKELALRTR